MEWAANLDAAAFGAVVAAASGVLVPRIIERVPEPEPDEPDEPDELNEPNEPNESDEAGAVPGAGGQAPRFEGASQPDEGPKETYGAIADRPGLLWKCVLAALVCGGLIGRAVGWDWSLLFLLPLVPVSLALTVIDWRTKLLPTWLIARTYVGLIVLVLVATLATQDWDDLVRAGIGWAGAGLLFFVLWYIHPRGLGYGDVRLSGILGIALGWVGTAELVVGIYAAFLLGGVGGALLSRLRIVDRKGFPFGPFMFVGALAGLLVGDWVAGLTTM
jgi:leader peptidase (prepilin peptidase) / N-methyltransferase